MGVIEPGRLCLKTRGRDAGRRCVITRVIDANYVEILCAGRKGRRRCNVRHLEPLNQRIEVKDEAEVKKMLM